MMKVTKSTMKSILRKYELATGNKAAEQVINLNQFCIRMRNNGDDLLLEMIQEIVPNAKTRTDEISTTVYFKGETR